MSENNNFEEELRWCIEQLQLTSAKTKSDTKRYMEASKALKSLTSPKAPLVKKRQIMQMAFGDYRKKMHEDSQKFAIRNSKMVIRPTANKTIKKPKVSKMCLSKRKSQENSSVKSNTSDINKFCFNFPKSDAQDSCHGSSIPVNYFKLEKSNDNFMFNFNNT